MEKKHVDLNFIESFLRHKTYPEYVEDKGQKRNFRKACKHFSIVDGHLTYNGSRRVIFENDRKQSIIHDVHEGINETPEAIALSGHRGRESTYQKISKRFYWRGIVDDVRNYIKTCKKCQQQGNVIKKICPELQSIPVDSEVMKQVGIDLCNLPDVSGYKHLIVLIDYFSKWSEAKPVKDKSAPTVARFLYEMMCRHGCFKTQINDQGREFVNEVSKALLGLTGTEQRVTSAYHPQSNGLCERQNRTIKDSLIKVLEENPKKWPDVIEGVLFAHRVSVHYSTKFSPFFLMYNRQPTLPVDIKYDLIKDSLGNPNDDPYDFETFSAVLMSTSKMRDAAHDQASQNIKKAQGKQRRDYNNRHCTPLSKLQIGSKVLLQNLKRKDRKGGKFTYKWIGPYTVQSISKTGMCVLSNQNGITLKKKYNVSILKEFHSDNPESLPARNVEDTAPQPAEIVDDEDDVSQPLKFDEDSDPKISINHFDQLPTEIILMILQSATFHRDVNTYNAVYNTCLRFRTIIEEKKSDILPRIYLDFYDNVLERLPRRGDKFKVSVNKLSRHFGIGSSAIDEVRKAIGNKNWRSAWLVIERQKHSWFLINCIFWKKKIDTNDEPDAKVGSNQEWLHNRLYILSQEDKKVLLSECAWLNDQLMDAAQKLICEEIGTPFTFQSVLNSQKRDREPFRNVYEEHIQLLHDGSNHWILSFCSNGRVQVCDSLYSTLTRSSRKSIRSLYKNYFSGTEVISFLPVQRQPDSFNCGLFAIAFAAELLDGKSPSDATFSVDKMRNHFLKCLEKQKLSPFPKETNI